MNVLLSWTPTVCSSPLGQRVEYRKKSDSAWTLFAIVPCEVSSVTIVNLEDEILYEFRVGAICSEGGQDRSVSYTAYDVQIKQKCPEPITITPNQTSVTFEFLGSIGDIDSYDIYLYDENNNQLQVQNVLNNTIVTGSFINLTSETVYKIKVAPKSYFNNFVKLDCAVIEFETLVPDLIDCSLANFDIIIVNDESGSIGLTNYNTYVKPGIIQIARSLSALIGSNQIRIGVIGFATVIRERTPLSFDYPQIYADLTAMPYMTGFTNTAGAIDEAKRVIEAGVRNVPQKVIVITDGDPNMCGSSYCGPISGQNETESSADELKAIIKGGKPVEIITVGVANANNVFLSTRVASDPLKHYQAADFQAFESVANTLALDICANIPAPLNDPCLACTGVTASIINTQSSICYKPSTVNAQIFTLQTICNSASNVKARLITTCAAPGSAVASLV